MLSQKIQDDLMTAYQKVHEEKRGHAAGDSDVEKQASQLASDVRYKSKGKVKEGASDEEKKKVFLQILGTSPAPSAVKEMAKTKLLGEEVVSEMRYNDGKSGERLKALAKKRGIPLKKMKKHPQFQPEEFKKSGMSKGSGKVSGAMKAYLDNAEKMQKADKKKKKTGNPAFDDPSHHSFRKSQYNSHEPQGDVISEKKKESNPKNLTLPKGVKSGVDYTKTGSSTAYMGEAKKAKKDYDGDGKVESGTQEFLGSRDKAIKKAIAKRRGRVKEGFSAWRIDLDFNEQVKK